jgi:hypothetical protein
MIDALQLRHEIIRPTLKHLDSVIPYSMAAENLLMGTCAQESRMGQFLVQLDNGPAKGIFQMEPATHNDIWENFMSYRQPLYKLVQQYCVVNNNIASDLTGNLFYAAAMCRVHYYRVPMAMPEEDSIEQLANYWKIYYNTPEGKGTVAEFIHNYNRYVA